MSDENERPPTDEQLQQLLPPPDTDQPMVLINWLATLDAGLRLQYGDILMQLVRARPPMEQEALLHIIKDRLGFQVGSMREQLKTLNKAGGARFRSLPTYLGKNKEGRRYLAEMVYRPEGTPQFGFLVQWLDDQTGSPEFYEKLQGDNEVEIHPLVTKLAESGAVLLPSSYEEYGTDHELFVEIRNFINTFVQLEDNAFRTMACCYVLLSWMYDRFYALPYFRAHGDYGVGKSRLIQVVGSVCYRPVLANGATTASPIFRIVDRMKGTLVIDEADFSQSDLWEEIVKILNAGYQRFAPVLRSERAGDGEPFDVHAYDCYGPKLLSTRKQFTDTALESRCFSHTLTLVEDLREDVPLVLDEEFFEKAQRLRNQLLLWRFRNYNRVKVNSRERLVGADGFVLKAEPRATQIMQPVLACTTSEAVRREVLKQAVVYADQMDSHRREGLEGVAAQAAVQYWDLQRKPVRMLLKSVTEYLQSRSDLKDVDSRKMGKWLRNIDTAGRRDLVRTTGGEVCVFLTEAKAARWARQYKFERATPVPDATGALPGAAVPAGALPPGPGV